MTGTDVQSSTVRWGIVGTGTIALHFASDIQVCKLAELVAVCSRSQESANRFAARTGTVNIHLSVESLLADRQVDAVYIATPNHTHLSIAKAVIEAGKPVLVEKPLAGSAAEAKTLVKLAAQENVFLMEAMWSRFLPAWQFVKQILEQTLEENSMGQNPGRPRPGSGRIGPGPVNSVTADLAFYHAFEGNSRFYDPAKGGGAMRDLGVYPLSLALYLFGHPVAVDGQWTQAKQDAKGRTKAEAKGQDGVDVSARFTMTYDDFSCRFSCAIDRNGSNLFLIEGRDGSLVLAPPFIGATGVFGFNRRFDFLAKMVSAGTAPSKIVRAILKRVPFPGIEYHAFEFSGYGLQFEIEAASRAILAGDRQERLSPVEDSCETLQIIEKILQSVPVAQSDTSS